MASWKVIYVSSRSEKKVVDRLKKAGIEAYVPMKRELRQWSDRKKMIELPMISGYVFVRPTAVERDSVLHVGGALKYVRYDQADAVIREEEILALKNVEAKGYHIENVHSQNLSAGDFVMIHSGPFKGLRGLVGEAGDNHTYTIMIDSIDYSLKLFVPKELVEKHTDKSVR